MSTTNDRLPPRLREIVEDFSFIDGREKLEYLLEFAQQLPALPERLQDRRAEMNEVHECMTPVYVLAEMENGGLYYHFDIPPEGPTVRGYAEIMRQGMEGRTPREVLDIPDDFYMAMGLQRVLTSQRLHGMSAILAHIKRLARQHE